MSNVTQHQRPGVYSVYDASSAVSGRVGGKAAAIAAICAQGTAGQIYTLTGYDQIVSAFGTSSDLSRYAALLLTNGASKVYAVPIAAESDYAAAFLALETLDDVTVVVCPSDTLTVQQTLRDSVKRASAARRERLCVLCGAENESAADLVARAAALNCERAVLVAPGGADAACAVAGAIAGEPDPAIPLGGAELNGITSLPSNWTDTEIDILVLGGVTPLESVGGTVGVVRGVTTRTTTGSEADATWRELTTVRVIDDVIPSLRAALRARFNRTKNTPQGREAIRSQVVVELENKLAAEIITAYDAVTVSALDDNPTVCLVEFRFTVAHGLNQIWLSAHITV